MLIDQVPDLLDDQINQGVDDGNIQEGCVGIDRGLSELYGNGEHAVDSLVDDGGGAIGGEGLGRCH